VSAEKKIKEGARSRKKGGRPWITEVASAGKLPSVKGEGKRLLETDAKGEGGREAAKGAGRLPRGSTEPRETH